MIEQKLNILFFVIGDLAISSSRARVYEYLPYFRNKAVEISIIPLIKYENGEGEIRNRWIRYGKELNRVLSVIRKSPFFEVVVIQRLILPPFLHSWLRRRSRKMVYDIDDGIYTVLSGHREVLFKKRLNSYDGVIVSNDFLRQELAPYAKKSITLPTCVDTERLIPKVPKTSHQERKVKIGWIGTPHTEKYLFMLQSVFEKLVKRYDCFELHLISSGLPLFPHIPLVAKRWRRVTEVTDLQEFDIGIMPLSDGRWEQLKSGYKILQYMAVGIPVVVSAVGVNKFLVKHGENGFVADTEEDWIHYLSLLIEDSSSRLSMGIKGRHFVEKNFDHRIHFEKLYEFLRSL